MAWHGSRPANFCTDVQYRFTHSLTYEVTYGSLLQERRRALHARIIGAIEALYTDRLAEWRDRLAYHVVRGEVWSKAPTYFQQVSWEEFQPMDPSSMWWRHCSQRPSAAKPSEPRDPPQMAV